MSNVLFVLLSAYYSSKCVICINYSYCRASINITTEACLWLYVLIIDKWYMIVLWTFSLWYVIQSRQMCITNVKKYIVGIICQMSIIMFKCIDMYIFDAHGLCIFYVSTRKRYKQLGHICLDSFEVNLCTTAWHLFIALLMHHAFTFIKVYYKARGRYCRFYGY